MNFRKRLFISLSSITLLAFSPMIYNASTVFANSIVSIPTTAKPGTIITFDEDLKMHVHDYEFSAENPSKETEDSGSPSDAQESEIIEKIKEEAKSLPVFHMKEEIVLPEAQPGMTVYYDGMGVPTKIVDAEGQDIDFIKITQENGISPYPPNLLFYLSLK
jgi:hypothetical protein